jgi:asparagine synthase (glutamine-hydrolysing)
LQTHYLKEAITRIESQHPWLEIPAGTLPGKAVHVAMLLQMHDNIEGFMSPGGPPMITPLVAQPIVEACLHIPTWAWVHGGRDRAVARSAFRDMLPSVTIARREKQGPVSFDMQLLALRGAELREFLLGGLLAGQGIIDKRAVERSLKDILGGGGGEQQFLLELADVEAWCQHWSV